MPLAQHIMLRLVDSRVIAPTEGQRRAMARSTLTIGRDHRLLGFRGADTHVHMAAAGSRRDACQLARRVELSLRRNLALPVGFEAARVKPVRDQQHLARLFDYMMRQEQRHGTRLDPLFTASNLPDLLGMRLIGGYTVRTLRELLPRVARQQLLGYLGQPEVDKAPLGIEGLADAAAAAFALPHPRGNRRDAVRARRAAVHATAELASADTVAELLMIERRTVFKLRAQPVDAAAVQAVLLQLKLRGAMAVERRLGVSASRSTIRPPPPAVPAPRTRLR